DGQYALELFAAAARKERDDGAGRVQTVARAKLFARYARRDRARERVADELDLIDAARLVPAALERKDGEHQVNVAAHLPDAVRAPGPELRAYVVDDSEPTAVEGAREREVEVGPVNEDDRVGAACEGRALERAVGREEA